jgi:hypothetical protein
VFGVHRFLRGRGQKLRAEPAPRFLISSAECVYCFSRACTASSSRLLLPRMPLP